MSSADGARKKPGVTVLGMEYAAARDAEARHREAHLAPSPLEGVAYDAERGDHDMHRLVDSPTDALVEAFVDDFRALDSEQRERVRAALRMHDFYTLVTFSSRTVLRFLRDRDPALPLAALEALTAVDGERIDRRDLQWEAGRVSWAVGEAGLDQRSVFEAAAARSEPRTAATLTRYADRPSASLRECAYEYAESRHGPGLVRRGSKPFAPSGDLTAVAYDVADVFEADAYHVSDIQICCDLPDVWLRNASKEEVRPMIASMPACATIHADLRSSTPGAVKWQELFAFLGEAANADDAELLAKAADGAPFTRVSVVGVRSGALVCVLVGGSWREGYGPFESLETLRRFAKPVRAALGRYGSS